MDTHAKLEEIQRKLKETKITEERNNPDVPSPPHNSRVAVRPSYGRRTIYRSRGGKDKQPSENVNTSPKNNFPSAHSGNQFKGRGGRNQHYYSSENVNKPFKKNFPPPAKGNNYKGHCDRDQHPSEKINTTPKKKIRPSRRGNRYRGRGARDQQPYSSRNVFPAPKKNLIPTFDQPRCHDVSPKRNWRGDDIHSD